MKLRSMICTLEVLCMVSLRTSRGVPAVEIRITRKRILVEGSTETR